MKFLTLFSPPPLRRWLALLAAAALPLALAPAALAAQLVPQNLTQLIAKADTIVIGRVSKVSDGLHKGMPYTEVTIQLSGSAKRELPAGGAYTFRQYGLLKARRMADGRFLLPARIEGMPSWTVGEHVMSFMNKPGEQTGLVTPVGLAQGKFSINGTRASNGFNNVGLFEQVKVNAGLLRAPEAAMLASRAGGVELGVLQGLVQRAVKNDWVAKGEMR